jgi:ABC-type multidrug transport system ATPase subunit
VTGSFKPGRVTAVMGPSGAGKTILLSAVLDKLNSAWTKKGTFHVNGQYSTQDVRSALGFVPQDDVLHTDLTVQENLYFSGETRLPSSWTASERQEVRELVVQALGLDFVRHVRVGDELTRGISGGQRKRCSIGLELCAMPSALFLDEPTTGLDASTALDLCHLLKRLAEGANLTIGMVIHQPRVEIWEALDELLILAPGGRTVYQGPQRLAQQYFDEVLGLDFSYGNPADIILDGVAANPCAAVEAWNTRLEKGGPSPRSVEAAAVAFQQANETHESNQNSSQPPAFVVHDDEPEAQHAGERRGSSAWKSPEPANADANNSASRGNSNSSNNEPVQVQPEADGVKKENEANVVGTAVPDRSGASFFRQVLLAHNRNLMKQYSRWHTLVLDISLGMIASTLMGAAALRDSYIGVVRSEYILLGPKMKIFLVPMLAMFYMLSIASSVAAAGIRTFGSEQPQYWREASAGHNRLAYFIGYTLGDLYRLVLGSLHFSLIAYLMWEPVQGFGSFFLILFLVFLNVDSQSALLSMFLRPDSAPLLSTVIAVFMGLLNGYPGIPLINPVSYAWWATEAFLTQNVMPLTSIYSIKVLNDNWGYTLDRFGFNIGMLILYFFLYRIGAFLLMICLNREKQR